jgi:hypothetical protein
MVRERRNGGKTHLNLDVPAFPQPFPALRQKRNAVLIADTSTELLERRDELGSVLTENLQGTR